MLKSSHIYDRCQGAKAYAKTATVGKILLQEHSENRIITCFENEVGPGTIQSSVQYVSNQEMIHRIRIEMIQKQLQWFVPSVFLQHSCLFKCWIGAF